jgi:hypothetical protein
MRDLGLSMKASVDIIIILRLLMGCTTLFLKALLQRRLFTLRDFVYKLAYVCIHKLAYSYTFNLINHT